MDFSTTKVGQVSFSVADIDAVVERTVANAAAGRGQNLRFSNAYCVGLVESDATYRLALQAPGNNFADGLPIALLLRKANGRTGPLDTFRVRGPTFFEKVLDAGCEHGLRHSFIGSTTSTLNSLMSWVERTFPAASIAGVYAPPFSPVNAEFLASIRQQIEAQDPDVVWLGLGTPKQDITAMHLAEAFPNLTFASVGAAFDFKAGVAREAPRWIQKSGFEWLYRLLTEPARLWRRYTVGSLHFFQAVLRQRS